MSARDEAAGGVELRPCRWCGAAPTVEPWHGGAPTKVMISCPGTFATSVMGSGEEVTCEVAPHVTGETFEEAAEFWNRPSPRDQASSAMLGALEKLIGVCEIAAVMPASIGKYHAFSWESEELVSARKAVQLARSAGIKPREPV